MAPLAAVQLESPAAEAATAFRPAKPTLFDTPLSNNGARCRYVIYKKGLQDEIDILSPAKLGGLKSPEYLQLNPQGKMPLLVLPDGTTIPESEVIVQYLLDKYKDQGPSFLPSTLELRTRATLMTRIVDLYINTVQGVMYKPMDIAQRAAGIKQLAYQLDVLEDLAVEGGGPYLVGELSCADSAFFPTLFFMLFMLPQFFGWKDVFAGRPKLQAWWTNLQSDADAAKVIEEVNGGFAAWTSANRWERDGIIGHVQNTEYQWSY